MARIRKANKNSNMMIVRAYEGGTAIEVLADEDSNSEFANAWIAAESDGETPLTEVEIGATVYLVLKADALEQDVAGVKTTSGNESVAGQTGPGSYEFEVPEIEDDTLTVYFESGK